LNLTLTRKDLAEGLQAVSRVVSGQTSLPVLKNVLIEPGVDAVKLSATDLELGVECRVPAAVAEGKPLTVPAKTLHEIVAALPDGDVCLKATDDKQVVLTCGRAEYSIHGLPATDFPALPEVDGETEWSLPQPLVRSMIQQTLLAVSKDETRPILTGVFIEVSGGQVRFVATDTHRLAVRTVAVEGLVGDRTAIVPARALAELAKALGDKDEELVKVRLDANQALFQTDRYTLVSRRIDGQFPRYERVLPASHTKRLTIPREEFASVLRRARIVAREAAAANRVVLRTSGESLLVTAEAGDLGRAHEEVEILREGDDIELAFNGTYLEAVLGVIAGEMVAMELTDPLAPVAIKPVEGTDYIHVIMPMVIQ
jgi:DNA polymerase III subunit beta